MLQVNNSTFVDRDIITVKRHVHSVAAAVTGDAGGQSHRLSSHTQISIVAEPSIGSLIGSLEAEGQLE